MRWSRLSAAALAALVLTGCQLFAKSHTPPPERALASEGLHENDASNAESEPSPLAAGDGGVVVGAEDGTDNEPDLHADDDEAPSSSSTADRTSTPLASHYARLDRSSCEAELERRHVSFERVGEARGVVAPLRLTGPLSGVTFRSNLPASKARTSPYDIYDCRLVLALDDFARTILARHDIVEVIHLSVYRPVSSKVTLKGSGRRHTGALAIDAAIFKTKDGRSLSVEKDFQPRRIGVRPCSSHEPKEATELRHIACEAAEARLFNVLLTPNFNWAHRNHYHMEVTANVGWTLIR